MNKILTFLLITLAYQTSLEAQYCVPAFSFTPCGCCTANGGDVIENFRTIGGITDITNLASGCGGSSAQAYTYYAGMTLTQSPGQTFYLACQSSQFNYQGFRVWIDYNNDFDFDDADEDVWNSATVGNAVFSSLAIQIPATATPGLKRMRVMSNQNAIPPASSWCVPLTANGECEDYDVMILAPGICNGQPSAGNILTDTPYPCIGMPFTLSLSGVQDTGLTYQWLSSSTGNPGSWLPIAGATSLTYASTANFTTNCYRCIVTCTATNLFDTSNVLCLEPGSYSPYSQCYCKPQHIGGATNCITEVILSGINNVTGGCTGDFNFNIYGTPTVNASLWAPLTLTVATATLSDSYLWVDYNHNGVFEYTEKTVVGLNTANASVTFTIPLNAIGGLTRMRIRSNQVGGPGNDPCTTYTNGETEDYILDIGFSPTSLQYIQEKNISIYPNPARNVLHIDGSEGEKMELFNTLGQRLISTTSPDIKIEHLPTGLYFLECRGQRYKVLKKAE